MDVYSVLYSAAIPIILVVCTITIVVWAVRATHRPHYKVDDVMRRWPTNEDETP